MAYIPKPFSGASTPEAIRAYVEDEFNKIAQAFAQTDALDLRPINAPPKKPREGMIVFADGTDWDPGAGKGTYNYSGGTWNKL